MSDSIDRQAAIDALWKALYEYEDKTEKQFQESEDLDVGDWIEHRTFVQNMNDIDRQTILNLPSAQPETEERTLTEDDYAYCMNCDHVEMCRWYPMYGCEFKSKPSAQPDLQECEKCIFKPFKQFQPEQKSGKWEMKWHRFFK